MNLLESRLTLHIFLCREFGYGDLFSCWFGSEARQPGLPPTVGSEYARALCLSARARITPDQLEDYGREVAQLSRDMVIIPERGQGWKLHHLKRRPAMYHPHKRSGNKWIFAFSGITSGLNSSWTMSLHCDRATTASMLCRNG